MIEPITLTVAELAARWGQTPRQVLQFALHKCFPMHFYFDGLVFDAADEWHRANGAWLENQERERLEKSIAVREAQLQRHLQYIQGRVKLTEWEQPMDTDAVKAVRMLIDEDGARLRHIRERLKMRDTQRLACSRNGLVRAMPGTLQSVLERGSEPFPRWGYRPGTPVKIIERGENQFHLDGHIWALEDARYPKDEITADDLQALIEDVKAVEASQPAGINTAGAERASESDSHRAAADLSQRTAKPVVRTVHQTKTRIRLLDAEVATARENADASDQHAVWTALVEMALAATPPFTGEVDASKGIAYNKDGGVAYFSKDALRQRLKKLVDSGR